MNCVKVFSLCIFLYIDVTDTRISIYHCKPRAFYIKYSVISMIFGLENNAMDWSVVSFSIGWWSSFNYLWNYWFACMQVCVCMYRRLYRWICATKIRIQIKWCQKHWTVFGISLIIRSLPIGTPIGYAINIFHFVFRDDFIWVCWCLQLYTCVPSIDAFMRKYTPNKLCIICILKIIKENIQNKK